MTDTSIILDALGHGTRRAIIGRLTQSPASVADLTRGLDVTQSAVSQHLAVLRKAGLVTGTPQGARVIYGLRPEGLKPIRDWLDTLWGDQLAAYKSIAEKDLDA